MDWFVVWHMKEGIICCLIWKLQGSQIMLSCQTSLVTLVPSIQVNILKAFPFWAFLDILEFITLLDLKQVKAFLCRYVH